jgi:hypothetical protein
MMDCYDKEGRPISIEEWGRLKGSDPNYYRVAKTDIGPWVVSTVWLGLDHRYWGEGPPVIFETMVFRKAAWYADRSLPLGEREGMFEQDCVRYCTEEEALAGHEEMVLLIRATTNIESEIDENTS